MNPFVPDPRNVNSLWAGVLVETLVRCGVGRMVISPGSRSTPVAMAAAAHRGIEAIAVVDERSAGFFALGLAKQSARPVALLCTSGSAPAHYFPAVIEAHESGVPLIVLSADRPPELRDCASGQTINQTRLFGDHVVFFHELAVPEATEPRLRYLRQTVAHAVERSLRPAAGPVHLNLPFRDPLPPLPDDGATAAVASKIDWDSFFSHLAPAEPPVQVVPVPPLQPDVHGAIVVGPVQPADPERFCAEVGEIARRLGWPVLADAASPVRFRAGLIPGLVSTYDLILRNPTAAERLRPEAVLCIGDWPASKVLRGWVEQSGARVWMAGGGGDNRDGLHGRTRWIGNSLAVIAQSLPEASEPNGYQRMWARLEAKARAALDARLEAETQLFEPKAAWLLSRKLPAGSVLAVASSMPVRDLEYVACPGDTGLVPRCNRGANGIDGTLSTACGVAHGAAAPVTLLTGDLAFLHDSNGLLLRQKLRGSLTVVLVNNRGGGIFGHLPVAAFEPPFEEFFATPQEVDFSALCAAHGVSHTVVRDWNHFSALITAAPANGIRVLELRTERKLDAARRKQWFSEIAAGL